MRERREWGGRCAPGCRPTLPGNPPEMDMGQTDICKSWPNIRLCDRPASWHRTVYMRAWIYLPAALSLRLCADRTLVANVVVREWMPPRARVYGARTHWARGAKRVNYLLLINARVGEGLHWSALRTRTRPSTAASWLLLRFIGTYPTIYTR